MLNRRHTFTAAALAVLLVLAPPQPRAAEQVPDTIPGNGKVGGVDIIGGWDGTAWRSLSLTSDGVVRVREEFPSEEQADRFIAAGNPVGVHTGLKQIGLGWAVSPFGDRLVKLRRVATGGAAVNPLFVYLFGSDDDVTYTPLAPANAWVAGAQALTDTVQVDTLRAVFPSSPATAEFRITLPAATVYPGRYLAIYAKRDSTASSAQTLTVEYEGRWR
jgi:hypothetical protein